MLSLQTVFPGTDGFYQPFAGARRERGIAEARGAGPRAYRAGSRYLTPGWNEPPAGDMVVSHWGGADMRLMTLILLAVMVLFVLAGCAPGPNDLANTPNASGVVPGFWRGLWNGLISPVTFIISLFNRNVQVYEVHNNGNWYNFGFMLGVAVAFSGSAGGAASRRRWRK
jgi:hypothetical protein